MRIIKWVNNYLQQIGPRLKALPGNVLSSFKRRAQSIKNLRLDMKQHPKATTTMLLSAALMGLGQVRNKQYYKAIFFFGFFFTYLLVELATSGYIGSFAELAEFPDDFGIIYVRDYGGLFVRGLWGFVTLGSLVVFDFYRGGNIRLQDNVTSWRSADVSNVLLGQGIIVVVLLALLLAVYIANAC